MHHRYWAHAQEPAATPEPHAQLLKPSHSRDCAPEQEEPPWWEALASQLEAAHRQQRRPSTAKNKQANKSMWLLKDYRQKRRPLNLAWIWYSPLYLGHCQTEHVLSVWIISLTNGRALIKTQRCPGSTSNLLNKTLGWNPKVGLCFKSANMLPMYIGLGTMLKKESNFTRNTIQGQSTKRSLSWSRICSTWIFNFDSFLPSLFFSII